MAACIGYGEGQPEKGEERKPNPEQELHPPASCPVRHEHTVTRSVQWPLLRDTTDGEAEIGLSSTN
jgi:hypothetical protein